MIEWDRGRKEDWNCASVVCVCVPGGKMEKILIKMLGDLLSWLDGIRYRRILWS